MNNFKRIIIIEGQEYMFVEDLEQFKLLCEAKTVFLEPVVEDLYRIVTNNVNEAVLSHFEDMITKYICYTFETNVDKRGLSLISHEMPCKLKVQANVVRKSIDMAIAREEEEEKIPS